MTKTILITGSTDGLGLATAKTIAGLNHNVLLHGRSTAKLEAAQRDVVAVGGSGSVETYAADLSRTADVTKLAAAVTARHDHLDVLINNAGVFQVAETVTADGLDVRFVVNVIAPYLLTKELLPLLASDGRIINLSSAAQAPVDPAAFAGRKRLDHGNAYAQSKLALTMWSNHLAQQLGAEGPAVIAVNPGSFLGTKMVEEAYGQSGKDVGIGADILTRAATSSEFADVSGRYFDNDSGRFASPHPDALDPAKNSAMVDLIASTTQSISA